MPRASVSNDYLYEISNYNLKCHDCHHQNSSLTTGTAIHAPSSVLSPKQIDSILSFKLYAQMKSPLRSSKEEISKNNCKPHNNPTIENSINLLPTTTIDADLIALVDQFFYLTYLNTIPMVNLLATAIATNFLKENIQALDRNVQQQITPWYINAERVRSPFNEFDYESDNNDNSSFTSLPI